MSETARWTERDSRDFMEYGPAFVPCREVQTRIVCDLVPATSEPFEVVDLGCGPGSLCASLLRRFPQATIVGIDGSAEMLGAASRANAEWGQRFVPQRARIERWRPVQASARAVVTSLALHHLSHPGKRALFSVARSALLPGGALVVADLVAPATAAGRRLAAALWDEQVRRRSLELHGDLRAFDAFRRLQWNMYALAEPDPEDHPAPLADQLQWLAAAGFEAVDVYWMWAGHAVFGGRAP